jgi:leader peptidase (prepilin peptidase)/N-methyltransferase
MAMTAMVVWMVLLSGYDVAQHRLPNWLTLPGAVVVVAAAFVAGRGVPAVAGGAALAALYWAVHLVSRRGIGAGDVKLALGVGALTGWFGADVWFLAALGAPLLTAAAGLVALVRGVRAVPHGPSMCLASAIAVVLAMPSAHQAQKHHESLELRMFDEPASARQPGGQNSLSLVVGHPLTSDNLATPVTGEALVSGVNDRLPAGRAKPGIVATRQADRRGRSRR